jgi:hypothetical protein
MQDFTSGLIAVLRKYTGDTTAPVGALTPLSELGIDDLDVPMICLDIEDLYGVQISGGDTLVDLTARVIAGLAAKAQPRTRQVRRKSSWMSTAA